MTNTVFEFQMYFVAQDSDIDDLGHVNNVVYLKWIQEVAETHWTTLAPAALQQTCAWVVLRHEIDYLQSAMPGDKLMARTWIESYDGAKSVRRVELLHQDSRKVLCKARTTWVLLDPVSFKPKRIEEYVIQVLPVKPK